MHGGASPAVREAGQRRVAEAKATALLEAVWDPSASPVTDPITALQKLAGKIEHAVDVLGAMLDAGNFDSASAAAWTRVLAEQRKVLEGMARLDLGARQIELEQGMAALVTDAFKAAVAAVSLLPADKQILIRTFLTGIGRGHALELPSGGEG